MSGYEITYGGQPIFVPGSDEYVAHNCKISQATAGWTVLTFTLPGSHPSLQYIDLHEFSWPVIVTYGGVEIFRGIVTSVSTTFNLERVVTCASDLVMLDWVVTRYRPSDNRPGTALAELVGIYNNIVNLWAGAVVDTSPYLFAVDPDSRADYVGYLDPNTGDNACDAESRSPSSILGIINSKIVDPYGAYLRLRYEDGIRYIGIFDTPPDSNSQVIRLGENLMDYEYRESDDDMYTACYPVGGTSDEELAEPTEQWFRTSGVTAAGSRTMQLVSYYSGQTMTLSYGDILIARHYAHNVKDTSLTIGDSPVTVSLNLPIPAELPSGTPVRSVRRNGEYFDNTITLLRKGNTTIGEYTVRDGVVYHSSARYRGVKCMNYHDSDIKDVNQLLYRAIASLSAHIEPTRSLTVKAIDAAYYDSSKSHLKVGQRVRVVSPAHGLDSTMYVQGCDVSLDNPANTRYTLGTASPAITRSLADVKHSNQSTEDNLLTELNDIIGDTVIGGLS